MSDVVITSSTPCDCCGPILPPCRSKSGSETLPPCSPVFYPTSNRIIGDSFIGPTHFTWDISLSFTDSGDGTWQVNVTINSATRGGVDVTSSTYLCHGSGPSPCTNPDCLGGSGRVYNGGVFLNNGQCQAWFGGSCCVWVGGSAGFIFDPNIQAGGFGFSSRIGDLVTAFMNDPLFPYDVPGDCSTGFITNADSFGAYSFRYFEENFTFPGLTIGETYCVTINWERRPLSGGSWSTFATSLFQFTATSETETTDYLDPYSVAQGGTIGALQGYEYRVESFSIAVGPCSS